MIQKWLGISLKKLSFLERVWLLAPFVVWFSYQPLLRLGQDSTSYYELSIPLIYLVMLALIGIPHIWQKRRLLVRDKAVWLVSAFVGMTLLSLLWTPNSLRGILTTGIVGLLFLVFLALLAEQNRLKKCLPALVKVLVASGVVMSVLAFMQIVAGIWLSRSEVLLCAGCVADQFGFVRPNVFAIEPQFFGSLLLAPLFILTRVVIKGDRRRLVVGSFFILSTALFLTLSRGAIFAFGVGALLLFVLYRHEVKQLVKVVGILVGALVLTLFIQGTAAMVNPRIETTFQKAVAASLDQLTLGVIDLPEETQPEAVENSTVPAYDGYVEESTNVRLSLSQLALNTWVDNPFRVLFGVGVGGAGVAMHEAYPDETDARQIVQNQYIEILLEYGLIGFLLFGGILIGFLRGTWQKKWLWGLLLAYMVQWSFFSGYPNALHIYLVLMAAYVVTSSERHVQATRT